MVQNTTWDSVSVGTPVWDSSGISTIVVVTSTTAASTISAGIPVSSTISSSDRSADQFVEAGTTYLTTLARHTDLGRYPSGTTVDNCYQFQLNIVQGAIISTAGLWLYSSVDSQPANCSAHIVAESKDSPNALVAANFNITNRLSSATTNSISWVLDDTIDTGFHRTPDLSSVVQEIIDRPGWVADNYISLILSVDNGTQVNSLWEWQPWHHANYYMVFSAAWVSTGSTTVTTTTSSNSAYYIHDVDWNPTSVGGAIWDSYPYSCYIVGYGTTPYGGSIDGEHGGYGIGCLSCSQPRTPWSAISQQTTQWDEI